MNNVPNFTDLRVIFILTFKDEMIKEGIIPQNVKWDKLTEEQKENVKKFISKKIGEIK